MNKKKIQELAVKIKVLAGSPHGVDKAAAQEILAAATEIENETRKPSGGGAFVV